MDLLATLIATQLPLAERRGWMREAPLGAAAFSGAQLDWARRTRDRAIELGLEFLLFDDPRYPESLKSLCDAPLLL
jgi:predicted Rossmann fold nucleotide-binding protein DprA/Smf involved in DNA uptake